MSVSVPINLSACLSVCLCVLSSGTSPGPLLGLLRHVMTKGNTSVFEWRTGTSPPVSVVHVYGTLCVWGLGCGGMGCWGVGCGVWGVGVLGC